MLQKVDEEVCYDVEETNKKEKEQQEMIAVLKQMMARSVHKIT